MRFNSSMRSGLVIAAIAALAGIGHAQAADVIVAPAAGSGFAVKNAASTIDRMRVNEDGSVLIPVAASGAQQAAPICAGTGGLVGPCAPATALPAGTINQTLRYGATNTLTANNNLLAFADGGLLATGTFGTGAIPASGAGTRMMWYPATGSFRAGKADGNQWDDAQTGPYSFAAGIDTEATGFASTAFGSSSLANGGGAFAAGLLAKALGNRATAFGESATASGNHSFAAGYLTSATKEAGVALGSGCNATGLSAIAIGNACNASGNYSIALGYNVDTDSNPYSFVYGDNSATTRSTSANQFMVRASGGIVFYSSNNLTAGIQLAAGGGSWTALSDRNAKDAVRPVDARTVLDRVLTLPLSTWHYKAQDDKYRHMGPMAQDFYTAFHLGESDTGIDTIDADGVALAAIQGLHALVREKDAQIVALREQLAAMRIDIAAQRRELATLATRDGEIAAIKAAVAKLQRERAEPVFTAAAWP